MAVAELDPEPVAKGDNSRKAKGWKCGNGPRRGKKEKVQSQEDGREEVKAYICGQGKQQVGRNDERTVNLSVLAGAP